MNVKQLSTNGFHITDLLDTELFQEIYNLSLSFTPTSIRTTPDSKREVYDVTGQLRESVLAIIQPVLKQISDVQQIWGVELWRDYPRYNNPYHLDDPVSVKHVMIVYLDNAYTGMGTGYYENNQHYTVEYQENCAVALLNSIDIQHGMIGTVPADTVRRTLYINWR